MPYAICDIRFIMIDLTTKIKNLVFRNPVTVASGTFGTGDEYAAFVDYRKLGAIITKTITVKPRAGNPMPRICETAGGMLNAIGLQIGRASCRERV